MSPELRVPLPSRSMTSMCVASSAENRWNMIVSPWLTVKVGPGFVMFTGRSLQPLGLAMLAYSVLMIVCAAGAAVVDGVGTSTAGVASGANALATIAAGPAFSLDGRVS